MKTPQAALVLTATVLVGMQNRAQVEENVRVAEMGAFDVSQLQRVAEVYDSFAEHESILPEEVKK